MATKEDRGVDSFSEFESDGPHSLHSSEFQGLASMPDDHQSSIKNRLRQWWATFHFWRGLEVDEWDVHTIGTNEGVGTVNYAASIITDEGYKTVDTSGCACLKGKCGGFFDTFNAPVFLSSAVFVVAFLIFFGAFPDLSNKVFPPMKNWISTYLGWLYICAVDLTLLFLLCVCATRYGDIKLGEDDSVPEYSYISWATMLFSAGMGIGLVFYGVAEPLQNYVNPPHRIYGDSTALAFERAIPLTLFNWGLHAWATYSVLGLAICYFSARLKLPLSIRSALYPLLGSWTLRWPGHVIDFIAVMGTLCGLATSLGLGTIQLNAGLNYMNSHIPKSFWTQFIIIIVVTCMAMVSVLSGTSKGIKWLSNINTALAALLWASIMFISRPASCADGTTNCAQVSPDGSILENFDGLVQNFGLYWSILLERFFRTGGYIASEKEWMQSWTIYYLGWFVSWSPFVSTFLAEISRGRTMKQYIIGTLGLPFLVTVCWFTVFGLFGMTNQPYWTNPVEYPGDATTISKEDWNDLSKQPVEEVLFALYYWAGNYGLISSATVTYLSSLTLIVLVIFFVSSSDSGCLVITIIASGGNRNPPKWQKVLWVWLCALIAVVLLINGGASALESLQSLVITCGLPLVVIIAMIVIGLVKTMALDPYIVHQPMPIYPEQGSAVRTFKGDIRNLHGKARNPNLIENYESHIINTFEASQDSDVFNHQQSQRDIV